MKYKFKKGDKVVNTETREEDVVVCVPGDSRYDKKNYSCPQQGFVLKKNLWCFQHNWILKEVKTPIFQTKDSGKRVEFETGMLRDTQEGKPRYDLLYLPLLKRWAELMGRGAEKYGERNWEKAEGTAELERFKASAFRHFISVMNDENDEDHYAAVIFNLGGILMVKDKLDEWKNL